jgi:hypothetical protein
MGPSGGAAAGAVPLKIQSQNGFQAAHHALSRTVASQVSARRGRARSWRAVQGGPIELLPGRAQAAFANPSSSAVHPC